MQQKEKTLLTNNSNIKRFSHKGTGTLPPKNITKNKNLPFKTSIEFCSKLNNENILRWGCTHFLQKEGVG
jgi:hypothetical protein